MGLFGFGKKDAFNKYSRPYYKIMVDEVIDFISQCPLKTVENNSVLTGVALSIMAKYLLSPAGYGRDLEAFFDYFAHRINLNDSLYEDARKYFIVPQLWFSNTQVIAVREDGMGESEEERVILVGVQTLNTAQNNVDNQYHKRLVDITERIYRSNPTDLQQFELDVLTIIRFIDSLKTELINYGYLHEDGYVINWTEAYLHIGEYSVIQGPIVSVPDEIEGRNMAYVDIGETYPSNKRVSCVIWKEDLFKFSNICDFMGKTVRLHGKIDTYNNIVQVVIKDREQLEVLD